MTVDILPEEAPAPRLCHLIKWPDFDGYGFNLHAERSNPGQFIGKIDDDSPASMAGLREGDRIIEVNGVNINNENHRQVVERIKADPHEARLLVVDPQADLWYREQDLVVKSSQLNVVYIKTPIPRPQPDSPRAKHSTPGNTNQVGGSLGSRRSSEQVNQSTSSSSSSSSPQETEKQQQETANEDKQTKGNEQKSNESKNNSQQQDSLETSDFNDDSIEQQQKRAHSATPTPRAPMSPDSGRGQDDDQQHKTLEQQNGADELTVEAEINHRTMAATATAAAPLAGQEGGAAHQLDEEAASRKQKVLDEVKRQIEFKQQQAKNLMQKQANKSGDEEEEQQKHLVEMQPDSLQATQEQQEDEINNKITIDAKEHARQVHNRSADSGKSSSPDSVPPSSSASDNTGSRSSLAADSLDEHLQQQQQQQTGAALTEDSIETNTSSLLAAQPSQHEEDVETTIGTNKQVAGAPQQVASETTGDAASAKLEPRTSAGEPEITINNQNNNNNNNNLDDHVTCEKPAIRQQPDEIVMQQQASPTTTTTTNTTNNNMAAVAAAATTTTTQTTSANNSAKSSGGGGGLNLNMTASQMRELIASRKKFDPKKAQMNIRQKYEIIQQM